MSANVDVFVSSSNLSETETTSISAQSALGWFVMFMAIDKVAQAFVKNVAPSKWKNMDHDKRLQVTSGITSSVHSVVICAWILKCCFDEKVAAAFDTTEKRVLGRLDEFVDIFSFLSGFIMYDAIVILKKSTLDYAFVAHHAAVLISAKIACIPFTLYGTTVGILLELSTPLLNARNLLLNFGYKGTKLLNRVEQAFGLSFLLVRIVWGIPFSAWCIYEAASLYHTFDFYTKLAFFTVLTGNLLLNALNVFWTRKMLRMAFQVKKKKKSV